MFSKILSIIMNFFSATVNPTAQIAPKTQIVPKTQIAPETQKHLSQNDLFNAFREVRAHSFSSANRVQYNSKVYDFFKSGLCLGYTIFWGIDQLEKKERFYNLSNLLKHNFSFSLKEEQFIEMSFQKIVAAQSECAMFAEVLGNPIIHDALSDGTLYANDTDRENGELEKLNEAFERLTISDSNLLPFSQSDIIKKILGKDYEFHFLNQVNFKKMNERIWAPVKNDGSDHVSLDSFFCKLPKKSNKNSLAIKNIFFRFKKELFNVLNDPFEKVALIGIFEGKLEKSNETIIVPNHSVGVFKNKLGSYLFFNPNNTEVKSCQSFEQLMKECFSTYFKEENGVPKAAYSIEIMRKTRDDQS